MRPEPLQTFLDAAQAAFAAHVHQPEAKTSLAHIFAALKNPGTITDAPGQRLAACSHLERAADPANFEDADLKSLVRAFTAIEPQLEWRTRKGDNANASANFAETHANAMILGPGGIERRSDVWIGVSLVAPHVRYPDHTHPPDETYLVLSPGDFSHGGSAWFQPGIGGTFYNPPGIEHAMRSGDAPLFALWALWAQPHAA